MLIGGAACDLLFGARDADFRATRDLDVVLLLVEALTPEFGRQFWSFIRDGGYGTNEAMYFAEKIVQSGIRKMSFSQYGNYNHVSTVDISGFTSVMTSEYNINLRRFTDYIRFDLYRQGYGEVNNTFFREYLDYLSMQRKFYGKVKEKYPEHFKTAHDVIALKVNLARAAEQCENFEAQAETVKDLEYSSQGYCIVVPTEPRELADEGINLSHCVGEYIDRVASGECHTPPRL